MKKIETAYSMKEDVNDAVNEIKAQISMQNPKAVLFFSSSIYPVDAIAKAMQDSFESSKVFGCTTAGELVDDKMLKKSLVAMAFSDTVFEDVCVKILKDIDEKDNTSQVMNEFEEHFRMPVMEMDMQKYFGFILFDGLSGAEEKVMASLGSKTNVMFVGGSAGDDLGFKATWVFAGGKVYNNAAVLVMAKAGTDFTFIKTQSFNVQNKKMTATKVNESAREVEEFNGKPAAEEYARVLGVEQSILPEKFMSNPLGLVIDDEPFVRSPQQVIGSKVKFYCQILEGMELSVLDSTSIIENTKKAIEEAKNTLGSISGIVNFHCILRTLELESIKKESEYSSIFKDVPTIGFSTYGEAYLGHINQTSTMIAFK